MYALVSFPAQVKQQSCAVGVCVCVWFPDVRLEMGVTKLFE